MHKKSPLAPKKGSMVSIPTVVPTPGSSYKFSLDQVTRLVGKVTAFQPMHGTFTVQLADGTQTHGYTKEWLPV